MATTAKAREKLEEEIFARRSEEQRRASRRIYWQELLTSLWAPFTAFAIALVAYIVLVGLYLPAYQWAQPALKVFGLLMIGWFLALWLARLVFSRFRQLRKLRREARELSSELQLMIAAKGDKLDPRVRERLVEQAAVVDSLRIAGDVSKLESELKKLSTLAEKQLGGWRQSSTTDLVIGFLKALAIALLIRSVIIEPFKIPSGSMIPTLEIGDQIFVNKFIYGVRLPWLNKVPFVIVRKPERGDVIVFNNPLDDSKDFIKRVVGLPGDRVEIINETVHLNGVPQPRRLLMESFRYYDQHDGGDWIPSRAAVYEENLAGHPHLIFQNREHPKQKVSEGPWIVPPESVFVLGDNRDMSADSRLGFGVTGRIAFVPYGNIKGKAMIIWLSLSHGGFLGDLFGGTGLRTDRLFLPIR